MDNLNRYKQIQKKKIRTTRKIESYIPTPTKSDYIRGYIQRVFIQKVKKEFREERLLISCILHFVLKRLDYSLENISFM